MNSTLFNDRRATGLLNRVRQDVSNLRDDLSSLLSHTSRETLPNSARELADHARSSARDLADQARSQLMAGGAYAASRLRHLRPHSTNHHSASWVGGAILTGVLAYGIYSLCRNHCEAKKLENSTEPPPEDFPASQV
jgi:ElaB/YqjD/DUF883 family membrane-anchored ribosome-binding protein